MTGPLDRLREEKRRQREIEMKEDSDFMLHRYRANRTDFVERLFDLYAGSCDEMTYNRETGAYGCSLSLVCNNQPGIECAKYWISGAAAIDGITAICGSPPTEQAKHSAETVLTELLRDEYLLVKDCRRRSKGGPLAWLLNGAINIENLYFNTDKIGKSTI